ncbi:MAG TPA: tetratricopeptide repeat protein [Candidatus Cybelea sp.]|nr:tetratricopeptide repeat protein [Candidatus Cybelea sp.]
MDATGSSPGTLRFGVFEADLRAGELRKHGIRIRLQEQPFQILALLLKRPGELVTREELRQELWPAYTFVDFDRGLNKAMTKLRSALGDSAEAPRYIETLHRRGYRFLVAVAEQHENSPAGLGAHDEVDQHDSGKGDNQRAGPRSPADPAGAWYRRVGSLRHRNIAIAGVVLLMCFVGLGYLRVYHPVVFGGSAATLGPRRSLAVLGFRNLSANAQDGWLSTALADWLTTELSAGDQLRTIPAETVARMKVELSLPDVDTLSRDTLVRIRSNIGTDYVVAGSYATVASDAGGQMRLDLRLQNARTGETVVAVSESGTEANLFGLVAKAGEELRAQLGVGAITNEQAAEVATALPLKPEAAQLYWEGLGRLRVFDALTARDLLLKAVAAEPSYALSHSALATAWSQLGYDENARTQAKQAFDLSANLSRAERLLVEARYREASKDWPKAIEIYRALFEFFPDNLEYGLALTYDQVNAGQGKDALATVRALRTLPPPLGDDPRIDLANGKAAESLGDFKTVNLCATRAAQKARAAGASLLLARALLDQVWALENLGEFDAVDSLVRQAKQLYESAHDRKGAADAVTDGAIAMEKKGDYLAAKAAYAESLALYRELGCELDIANGSDNLADILLDLGDLSGARASYETALEIYRRIGHPDGLGLANNGLGDVLLTLGRHQEAKHLYEESLEECERIGDRSKAGVALFGLARVLDAEGDLPAALRNARQATDVFDQIGDTTQATEVRLEIAQILLEQGQTAAADLSARNATESVQQTRAKQDMAAAYLLLSRVLLAQGKLGPARAAVAKASVAAAAAHHHELELLTSVAAARVFAASGRPQDAADAAKRLGQLTSDAASAGFFNAALEARLALGQVELMAGDHRAGMADLEGLEKDAAAAGYLLIAEQAAAARATNEESQPRKGT